ncbi:MAG TPA: trypsin-like peptidase domain-containing protein [bacterium]|nr:trypsin-like peptidase domain-containing protein [bacterium]
MVSRGVTGRAGLVDSTRGSPRGLCGTVKVLVLGVLCLGVVAAPAQGGPADPADAVVQLIAVDTRTNSGNPVGAAFFVSSSGTALTSSHVVSAPLRDPGSSRLLAIVGTEFYAADVVCASPLPPGVATSIVPFGWDVAELRVRPSDFPFRTWDHHFATGAVVAWAVAHTGPLPRFPIAPIAGRPAIGAAVSVTAHEFVGPLSQRRTVVGHVRQMRAAGDGTGVFQIEFASPLDPEDSGSPVFDAQAQVIGLWTWGNPDQPSVGWAQDGTVLTKPCR